MGAVASVTTLMADQTWPTVAFLAVVALISGLARGVSGFGSALIFIPLAAPILLVLVQSLGPGSMALDRNQ